MEKYLVIEPSGDIYWTVIPRDQMLEKLYTIIGCDCIENVRSVLPDVFLIVDESGRVKYPPKPHNATASRLYWGWLVGCDDIVGPAVLASIGLVNGEYDYVPLLPSQVAYLRSTGFEIPPED